MDSLEFDLHALILDRLATVLSLQDNLTTKQEVERLLVRCPDLSFSKSKSIDSSEIVIGKTVGFMTRSYQQSISSLAIFAANTKSTAQLDDVLPYLLKCLDLLPYFSFEETLTWKDHSPPDELSGKLISKLLVIAINHSSKRKEILETISTFLDTLTELLKCGNGEYICSTILPLLSGAIRSIQVSRLAWNAEDFILLAEKSRVLIHNDSLSLINQALDSVQQSTDTRESYSKRMLARYQILDLPLSSHAIIFGLLTLKRNVLARVILGLNSNDNKDNGVTLLDSRDVSYVLTTSRTTISAPLRENVKKVLRATYVIAIQYFTELAKLVDTLFAQGKGCPNVLYAREIMAVSLNLASLSSLYLHEVDEELVQRMSASLFNVPQTPDVKVQTAALDAANLIGLNFPQITQEIINMIRQFLTTPSTIFELAVTSDDSLTIQQYAIDRLAQCLKLSNGDLATTTIYAFFNVLSAGGHERLPSSSNDQESISGFSRTEEQRQQVCENIICTITGVTCILQDEKITTLVVSLLGQRLRNDSPSLDALVLQKLVDIALISPESVFNDIIQKFSGISNQSLLPENRNITTSVLRCQLDLARRIKARPEFYAPYMLKILSLFVDRGVVIQQAIAKNGRVQMTSLAAELGILLPVLEELLAHEDFKAHLNASDDLVVLFRNVWFHCVLYGFVSEEAWVREWHDSLVVIAQKTPPLVLESAKNSLATDLQYNSVLRRGQSEKDLQDLRTSLCTFLPKHASEIRHFSFAEIVFLLSIYHVETMRSQMGQCSYVLRYFANQGVTASKLVGCMEEIGDQVIAIFTSVCSRRAIDHSIDDDLSTQVWDLLIGTCHRLDKVHRLSIKYMDALLTACPSLLCNKKLIFLLLELIELVWQGCETEHLNEYSPVYTFTSQKVGVTLYFPGSYSYRREMLSTICESARKWFASAMARAPSEIRGILESYLTEFDPYQSEHTTHMGRSIALEIGKSFSRLDYNSGTLPHISGTAVDNLSVLIGDYSVRRHYRGEIAGVQHWLSAKLSKDDNNLPPARIADDTLEEQVPIIKQSLALLKKRAREGVRISLEEMNNTLHLSAAILISLQKGYEDLIQHIAWIPAYIFTPESLRLATSVWNWIIIEKQVVEKRLMVEIANSWAWALRHRKGLFSNVLDIKDPFVDKMQYDPSDENARDKTAQLANHLFAPHLIWIRFLSSRYQAVRYRSPQIVKLYLRLLHITLDACDDMSNHALSREGRFEILLLGFKVLQSSRMEALVEYKFRTNLYYAAFAWFSLSPRWAYGGNKRRILTEHKILLEFYKVVESDIVEMDIIMSTVQKKNSLDALTNGVPIFIGEKNRDDILKQAAQSKKLLLLFLESEINRLATWCNPLNDSDQLKDVLPSSQEKSLLEDGWRSIIRHAWSISPQLAIQLDARYKQPIVQSELHLLIASNAHDAVRIGEACPLLLGDRLNQNVVPQLKYLLYWAPVPPITAVTYFSPAYNDHPLILQYAMRALEHHPVDVVFFYIPQIVQALRSDDLGYIERFIMGAARISQLFAHQIIWNMKANMFKDEDSTIPDALKPTLDRIIDNIVDSLSGEDKEFYEREFTFFDGVTSISGKLKPYIKKPKSEKKQKIDEELKKIKVDVGVYLPSNPEGIVIGIDYESGIPLQSHAKAPFMATFKIRKTKNDSEEINETLIKTGALGESDKSDEPETIDVRQSAIFKVGDDCRQDVLALQLIAIFKSIFTSVGLNLYLFPYRIVATAPGCGVIDVIPNSISRDQLGREKVNSLYDYFLTRYGGLDSINFQKARNCFIQSVAAYSVVSYLLQIKDRHNGNIMLNDEGHIIHIDFGFILDIAPGGITFESSPFKLTTEMIQVMGGSAEVQPFKWFSELCIKAYLASRPHAENIINCVALMLGSGLPCFKGEKSLKNLRSRFQLDKTERGAADFMIEKINESFQNRRTVLYDSFQKATNGIPY